jgi:hypothetical protein
MGGFRKIGALGRWVAKLVAHLLEMAVLWVRIQTFLKYNWPTHSSPPKNIQKKNLLYLSNLSVGHESIDDPEGDVGEEDEGQLL